MSGQLVQAVSVQTRFCHLTHGTMNTLKRILLHVSPLFVLGMIAGAATLPTAVSLHLQPDAESPTVGTIAAGMSVTPMIRDELSAEGLGDLPSGWLAMRSNGPFFAYVHNDEMGKDLTAKPGATLHAAPDDASPTILTLEEGDRADAVDLAGDWTKVVFRKELVVFFNALPEASPSEETNPAPAPATISPTAAPPTTEEPMTPAAEEAVTVQTESNATNAAPRTFQGYLKKTRRFLGQGPKLDYQLVDESNKRIALLDLSALLLTDPLDRLENRLVTVYGPGLKIPGVKDVVIRVETLRLAN